MRIVVEQEAIYELKNKLLEYVENIKNEFTSVEKLIDGINWEGLAHTAYITKYEEILEDEKSQITKLESLINFLDDVLLNYDMALDNIKGTYKNVGNTVNTYVSRNSYQNKQNITQNNKMMTKEEIEKLNREMSEKYTRLAREGKL